MKLNIFVFTILLVFVSGCSSLFGLRDDLNDQRLNKPVSGGAWPERSMLSDADARAPSVYDEANSYVGHVEQGSKNYIGDSNTWVPSDEQNRVQLASRGVVGSAQHQRTRVTKKDFWDENNEGSLWASDGQTNYFFTKNSIKGMGDIVSVKLDKTIVKDMASEMKRNLTENEIDLELDKMIAQNEAAKASGTVADADTLKTQTAGAERQPASTTPAAATQRTPTYQDIDLTNSIGVQEGEVMMAEIVERYPSGNYKIRGTKRVQHNGMSHLMTVVAIARGSDLNGVDTIESSKLYEYKINLQR